MESWESRLMEIECEAADLRSAIDGVNAQLAAKLPPPSAKKMRANEPMQLPLNRIGKRKKGENLRVVQGYLSNLNGHGATVAEIAPKVGVGVSSVHLVLTRHKDVFEKGNDGLWRIKR